METTAVIGPQTKYGEATDAMKYRMEDEGFRESINRVALGLKDSDGHYHELREVLLHQRFLPGGRIRLSIGSQYETTAYNCFVMGTMADSAVDGPQNIMQIQREAVATLRLGGGVGYDFSTLRPKGDPIRKLGSYSTGPISFMEAFDAWAATIAGAGLRRGAQMGIMRVDHPDIELFVRAKQNGDRLTRFNISIAITDKFMEAVYADKPFELEFNGEHYRTIDARELWEKIMRSTHDWAEPGVVFIDTINKMNNLWYCEQIAATNPCSEQPLPPYGACLLGSFNLTKYIRGYISVDHVISDHDHRKLSAADASVRWFDFDQLKADIPIIVRAMDNVVDRARYPLAQQKGEAKSKRRMGLGVTGLANAGEALGHPYGSPGFLQFESLVMEVLRDESYRASAWLAAEKGAFDLFDAEQYLHGKFVRTLPEDIRDLIGKHGIRNSHLTSIAPTGTISLCADNVSGGIEPVFALETKRPIQTPSGSEEMLLPDYGAKFFGVNGRLADDVSIDEHIAVLLTAQKFTDSAVSKTINMDEKKTPFGEFKSIYSKVHAGGGKGCSTFNKSGKRMALLTDATEGAACQIMADGTRSCE